MHNHKVYPLLTGYFTVAFNDSKKFPKVENIPSFIFLIITEEGEPIIVDSSFDLNHIPAPDSKGMRSKEQEITELLKGFNLVPSDIGKVIQTHLHWDHAANLSLFSKARVYVQVDEIKGLLNLRKYEETSFCPDHWFFMKDNFVLVDGDYELLPGIELLKTGGHTAGHQAVKISCASGDVVLLGDSPFTYEWLWTLIPEDYWELYKKIADESFFWIPKYSDKIKDWIFMADIIQGSEKNHTVETLAKMSSRCIFSHATDLEPLKAIS